LNLEGIAVNGQVLAIDSSVFTTSTTQGTIVDSGTTLAYLAEQAFDPFVNAVSSSRLLASIKAVEILPVSFLNFGAFPSSR
jgi:Xylanase inhibitor C-terminal